MNRRRVLIETSWNVKNVQHIVLYLLRRINRNIVECKAGWNSYIDKITGVLIETSWNVKERICRRNETLRCVLIETSWNVKTADIITKSASYQVLIETSWNVKLYPGGLFLLISSINRNIVECKEKLK